MSADTWKSLSTDDKQAVIEAYKSGNIRLFELTCASFQLDKNHIQILCKQQIVKEIEKQYNALKFSIKQKMKHIYIKYTGQRFDEQSLISQLKNLFHYVNSENITIITNFINNDESGLYPDATAYANRENTKKLKKSMRPELRDLLPTRMTQSNATLIIRILWQMQSEINAKIQNYKNILLNEEQFRIDMCVFIKSFDKKLKKCTIKARKVISIETLLEESSKGNKDRFVSARCDDMLTCEIILKKLKQQCVLHLSKIHNRAIDLNIATLNNDILVIKKTPFAFGTITPQSIFMEYNLMSIHVQNKLNKVLQLINTLSGIDASQYIGNVTKKERSEKTQKRRKKNTVTIALKRTTNKNKSKNESQQMDMDMDEIQSPNNSNDNSIDISNDNSIDNSNDNSNGALTTEEIEQLQIELANHHKDTPLTNSEMEKLYSKSEQLFWSKPRGEYADMVLNNYCVFGFILFHLNDVLKHVFVSKLFLKAYQYMTNVYNTNPILYSNYLPINRKFVINNNVIILPINRKFLINNNVIKVNEEYRIKLKIYWKANQTELRGMMHEIFHNKGMIVMEDMEKCIANRYNVNVIELQSGNFYKVWDGTQW